MPKHVRWYELVNTIDRPNFDHFWKQCEGWNKNDGSDVRQNCEKQL